MKKIISLYKSPINNLIPERSIDLVELYNYIKDDVYLKATTIQYRGIINTNEKAAFKRSSFPYITASGVFSKRADNALLSYSGLICIDIDHLNTDDLLRTVQVLKDCQYLALCFISPSADGIKAIFKSDTVQAHAQTFTAYRNYIADNCQIPINSIDSSCKNISRACFVCHDASVYINPLLIDGKLDDLVAIEYASSTEEPPVVNSSTIPGTNSVGVKGYNLDFTNKDLEVNFRILITILESKERSYKSPREPWIHKLASLCNQFGMSFDKASKFIYSYFINHPESIREDKPIDDTKYLILPVKDVYERYSAQHGIWDVDDAAIDYYETPTLPNVYDRLPPFLKNMCGLYTEPRDKDLILLSALTVLSSCFPNYKGIYDSKIVGANLFLFITAPASAGKGVILTVRALGNALQKQLDDEYRFSLKEYEVKQHEYDSRDDNSDADKPVKPYRKILFVPANITAPKIIETLVRNKSFGVIMDTEADTLTQALKSKFGNFSETIRKVFHHEPIELQRKLNDEHISMPNSYLSLLLSGTPKQVESLLHNVENGLSSRFLFYDFPINTKWRNVFEKKDDLPEIAFNSMSIKLCEYINELGVFAEIKDDEPGILFQLTSAQESNFTNWFENKQQQLISIYGTDILASLRRLGLISFRIAMLLSIIRRMGTTTANIKVIECYDDDFKIALEIIDTLMYHTTRIFTQLQKIENRKNRKKPINIYYEKLPVTFTRQESVETAGYMGIKAKTSENYIRKYIEDGILDRVEHGIYQKK